MKSKKLGRIFWLFIPLLSKNLKYARPFLVYKVTWKDYILLKISSKLKDYIPQFEFPPTSKPSTLYKKRNFVDPNILISISPGLLSHKIDEIARTGVIKEQGQSILEENFKEITEKVEECFSNKKFRGNRYKVRVK